MKVVCKYSGIPFECQHFPGILTDREAFHPVFSIPQKKLFQYTRNWANRELSDTDKYLLYIALFRSTEALDFRTAARWTPPITKTIEQNMESLLRIVAKINTVKHPSFVVANVAITQDTRDFLNSPHWIHLWEENFEDFSTGYKSAELHDRLIRMEQTIEKLVNDHNKPIEFAARHMANWAEGAAEFPTYIVEVSGRKLPINEYWKQIIIACRKEEQIFLIPRLHVEKLLEHLEENLDAGSVSAHTLFKLLRSGLKKQHNYLGLGDFDLPDKPFTILEDGTSVEDANKMAMVNSAPEKLPLVSEYPSYIAYARAKAKWDMKQNYIADQVAIRQLNDELLKSAEEDEPDTEETDEDDIIADEDEMRKNGGFQVDPDVGEL